MAKQTHWMVLHSAAGRELVGWPPFCPQKLTGNVDSVLSGPVVECRPETTRIWVQLPAGIVKLPHFCQTDEMNDTIRIR